jgi:hypothetical protein
VSRRRPPAVATLSHRQRRKTAYSDPPLHRTKSSFLPMVQNATEVHGGKRKRIECIQKGRTAIFRDRTVHNDLGAASFIWEA